MKALEASSPGASNSRDHSMAQAHACVPLPRATVGRSAGQTVQPRGLFDPPETAIPRTLTFLCLFGAMQITKRTFWKFHGIVFIPNCDFR